MYDWKGFKFKTLQDEVCYFEIAYLIKNDCGLNDVGRIWYKKKRGYTLFNKRSELNMIWNLIGEVLKKFRVFNEALKTSEEEKKKRAMMIKKEGKNGRKTWSKMRHFY